MLTNTVSKIRISPKCALRILLVLAACTLLGTTETLADSRPLYSRRYSAYSNLYRQRTLTENLRNERLTARRYEPYPFGYEAGASYYYYGPGRYGSRYYYRPYVYFSFYRPWYAYQPSYWTYRPGYMYQRPYYNPYPMLSTPYSADPRPRYHSVSGYPGY
jgi:hypothetical protein